MAPGPRTFKAILGAHGSIISTEQESKEQFSVLDLGAVDALFDGWNHNLPVDQLFYSVKCNPNPVLLGALAALGSSFDCTSKAEIESVLSLGNGVSPDRIIFANPCKEASHIKYAATAGVNLTTFNSEDELDKIKKWHPKCALFIRVKAPDDGGSRCPLGALPEEIIAPLPQATEALRLTVTGVSFHIDSRAMQFRAYREAIATAKMAFETAARLGMPKKYIFYIISQLMTAFALVVFVFPGACLARHLNQDRGSVFCGSLNTSYPFGLKNQPPHCGEHWYEFECDKNNRTTWVVREGKFSMEEIIYENNTMRVVDAGLDMDDCNSLPLTSVYSYYSSFCERPFRSYYYEYYYNNNQIMYVLNCTEHVESVIYISASRCSIKSTNASSYFYFLDGGTSKSDFSQSCVVEAEVPIGVDNISAMSTLAIYNKLFEGVFLGWMPGFFKGGCSNKLSFQYV
ncbi:Ornithine decarboxylase [Hibiscus syriacus]|uniref:Ornithine decarboxylase n=1 Tax=Hibiscus syriacus TaxID=106335 RepID=A0A6A3BS76_HIBSY|nr:Ornithine decarboxylase [Hibiscus syriacus]